MDKIKLASGIVNTVDQEYALAGISVIAFLPAGFPNLPGAALSEPLEIGRSMTQEDGTFELFLSEAAIAYACYLDHCHTEGIQLECRDVDGSILLELAPIPLPQLQDTTLTIDLAQELPNAEAWQQFGSLIQTSSSVTLDQVVLELTQLSPLGMFQTQTIRQRLNYLYGLETTLLDPNDALMQAGLSIRLSQLQNETTRTKLREQAAAQDIVGLTDAFDTAVLRANLAGGHLKSADILIDVGAFAQGDFKGGVERFFGPRSEALTQLRKQSPEFFQRFPWLQNTLTSYRDYLVEIWVKRATQQLQEQNLDANGAIEQLKNRFHQDFFTTDTTLQPACRLLNSILLKILSAPTGNGFGFAIAPDMIQPQRDQSDRTYLDYLISLTGLDRQELAKRYRLDLSLSDLDQLSYVQQNVSTLQRFFTDSFQSAFDPSVILPPLAGDGFPIINDFTIYNSGKRGFHGPFFWQYEEWKERNEPFYAENYFDIRRLFNYTITETSRTVIWGRTHALSKFISLDTNELRPFIPPATSSQATKGQELAIADQWGRNFAELQDWLNDAHKVFFAGFYSEAERKYIEIAKAVVELQKMVRRWWRGTSWASFQAFDLDDPRRNADRERSFEIKDPKALEAFETSFHSSFFIDPQNIAWHFRNVPYDLDRLLTRILPACLSEARLALGKYQEAVQGAFLSYELPHYGGLTAAANLGVFAGATPVEPGAKITPPAAVWWGIEYGGSLPYATDTAQDIQEKVKRGETSFFPANAVEKAFFRLKIGNAVLEWADVLYRTNLPQNIARARELYKGVLFLHGENPGISPNWGALDQWLEVGKLQQNPALKAQIDRAWIGFEQINAGLNYYGFTPDYVPPIRYRVLREAAERFATSAKTAQTDYLNYQEKYEQSILDEMTARSLVEKASYAIQIADEQVQIAQFSVGEALKQVGAVKAQIEAKKKEIADSESFFSQVGDFVSGMKDAVSGLASSALSSSDSGGVSDEGINYAAIYKVISSKGGTSAAAAGLTGSMAFMAGYGAFVYAGYMSMQSLAEAASKRDGELRVLLEINLPAAEKMVGLKQREVTIANLQRSIAQADYNFGQKLLAFYDYRFLSKAFWQQMSNFANRLMRRYLDLGGRTAWFAERSLSFELDQEIRIISFDYFPRQLRGVTGADTLQLHLAELEARRISGLSQTVPVKQTFSLARDFPIAYGQLKKHGICRFSTSETLLRLAYPGVYGYRLRNVSLGLSYVDEAMPHKGILSNQGFSMVSRQDGMMYRLLRYPDALPLSEFNLRDDLLVYDLPDETLLPFEGSGMTTQWELRLSRFGQAQSLENLTDVLITFDMRARYSATLDAIQQTQAPTTLKKSLLISGQKQNPGAIAKFKSGGGELSLTFHPALAAGNSTEKNRTITFLAVILSGVQQSPIAVTLTAATDGITSAINLENGVALSNADFLAGSNGGIALPLNALTGINGDQPFVLRIDSASNPGVDFSKTYDVQLLVEYTAQV